MSLHIESSGSSAPLVLLHGWGMHGGVWADIANRLSVDFRVHCVDLPGYGYSKAEESRSIDGIVDQLSAQFSAPLTICGWSLGGQIALRWAAREPEKVKRLILVTSTPCFTEREDWIFGMASDTLAKFASELEQNHAATLRRFIALQLRGSENERELLVTLREQLFSRGEPDIGALRLGLAILRDADLRGELPAIQQPTLAIAGERDKLTPPEASYYLAQILPAAQVIEIKGAAHAPFLSHPELFTLHLKDFMRGFSQVEHT